VGQAVVERRRTMGGTGNPPGRRKEVGRKEAYHAVSLYLLPSLRESAPSADLAVLLALVPLPKTALRDKAFNSQLPTHTELVG